MRRALALGTIIVVGALSIAAAGARAQAPKVIDIEKVKDNLYVLTTSTPGNPETFSGGTSRCS